jgi:hypothetical protein
MKEAKKMKAQLNSYKVWAMAVILLVVIAVPAAMARPEEIVGAVIDTGVGYAIIANSGEYLVLNQDLSKYVGETVSVNGNVEVGADSQAFDHIDTIQVLSPRDLIDPPVSHTGVSG